MREPAHLLGKIRQHIHRVRYEQQHRVFSDRTHRPDNIVDDRMVPVDQIAARLILA